MYGTILNNQPTTQPSKYITMLLSDNTTITIRPNNNPPNNLPMNYSSKTPPYITNPLLQSRYTSCKSSLRGSSQLSGKITSRSYLILRMHTFKPTDLSTTQPSDHSTSKHQPSDHQTVRTLSHLIITGSYRTTIRSLIYLTIIHLIIQ